MSRTLLAALLPAFCLLAQPTFAQDAVTAGELITEPPTLMALGFEWRIRGDANRNASADIFYREVTTAGDTEWREGLPLLRLQGEFSEQWDAINYTAPNMFAGSVFDLKENTEYEVRLLLTDPDGTAGTAERLLRVRTRAEPMAAEGGNVYHVYPTDYDGEMQQPGFKGLLGAWLSSAQGGDWANALPPRVKPGDILLVHAGTYSDPHDYYSHELISDGRSCCGTTWDGTYYLTVDGTAEQPIVIRAAGDGEVIFDGNGNEVLFDVTGGNYIHFEGLTFRNTRHAILAGRKDIAGAEGIVLKRNRFEDVGVGIHTDWSGSKNFYIADNVFIGRHDPNTLTGWLPDVWRGVPQAFAGMPNYAELSKLRSYYAIKVYGSGHVITHNDVRNFHDGITHATYGNPDLWPDTPRDRLPVAIDIYENDISNMHDNCVETDGSVHNIRVLRNRCFNSATGAMSFQPVLGGPVYFVRNVVYHAVGGILKAQANPSGILHYNNTYIGGIFHITQASNLHYRNNLILEQQRRPAVFTMDTWTNYSSSDYNGFMPNPGAPVSFIWHSPDFETAVQNGDPRVVREYATLGEYSAATGQDTHSLLVDYSVFRAAQMPALDAPGKVYAPDAVDLRLQPGSSAIDAGMMLPGVTDGFDGRAPDLGAYELGSALPHYGPRQ